MPNTSQALAMLYAVNCIGAVANIIHPLSIENEIVSYLKLSNSKIALTLDLYKNKVLNASYNTPTNKIIVTSIADELNLLKKVVYKLTNHENKYNNIHNKKCISLKDFLKSGTRYNKTFHVKKNLMI